MIDPNYIRLTDELERQLMRQAIEEQFRPRPMRALGNLLRKLFLALRSNSASRSAAANV